MTAAAHGPAPADRGFRSAAEGAEPSVYLATLPDDGPNGIHWGYIWTTDGTSGYGVIPW